MAAGGSSAVVRQIARNILITHHSLCVILVQTFVALECRLEMLEARGENKARFDPTT
jgi:hypothetical protein